MKTTTTIKKRKLRSDSPVRSITEVCCPICAGTGMDGVGDRCVCCRGEGVLSPLAWIKWKRNNHLMCTCGNPDGQGIAYDHDEDPQMARAHVRCINCSKVLNFQERDGKPWDFEYELIADLG